MVGVMIREPSGVRFLKLHLCSRSFVSPDCPFPFFCPKRLSSEPSMSTQLASVSS